LSKIFKLILFIHKIVFLISFIEYYFFKEVIQPVLKEYNLI
jgi:hypothetical protein